MTQRKTPETPGHQTIPYPGENLTRIQNQKRARTECIISEDLIAATLPWPPITSLQISNGSLPSPPLPNEPYHKHSQRNRHRKCSIQPQPVRNIKPIPLPRLKESHPKHPLLPLAPLLSTLWGSLLTATKVPGRNAIATVDSPKLVRAFS